MSEELDLGEDTKRALLVGMGRSGWVFNLQRVLREISSEEFYEYGRMEKEIKENWEQIAKLIIDVASEVSELSVIRDNFIWVFPRGLEKEVIDFIMSLKVDEMIRISMAEIITSGFALWKSLRGLSFPINASCLLIKRLAEKLNIVDIREAEASTSYRGWTAVFKRKYVVTLPPSRGSSKYYVILEGTLENKESGVSIPLFCDGHSSTDDEKPMIRAFEFSYLTKLAGFLDAEVRDEYAGKLLFHMLSGGGIEINMEGTITISLELPKEDFNRLESCLRYALCKLLQDVVPCYICSMVLTYPRDVFLATFSIYPSPSLRPASRVLTYLAMDTLWAGVVWSVRAKFLRSVLFERLLAVGNPGALGLLLLAGLATTS